MNNIKFLKDNAIYNMHKNYWRLLGVILILYFLLGGFRQVHIGTDVDGVKKTIVDTTTKVSENLIGGRVYTAYQEDFVEFILNPNKKSEIYDLAERHYSPTEGVFANIYNKAISSKSFTIGIIRAIDDSFFKNSLGKAEVYLLGSLFLFLVWIFIYCPIEVGKCRFILENRVCDDTNIGRIRFPWMVRSSLNVIKAMLRKQVYLVLWFITIIGFVIKYFSYLMVPYILAENPSIKGKDAIELSRNMMYGHKWQAFKIYFSFIGWYILSIFTFGILNMVFTNIYLETTIGEFYPLLRRQAKENNIKNSHLLFDDALFENHFAGSYDMNLYPIDVKEKKKWIRLDYTKDYKISSLVMMFFTFSFIGWLWEAFIYIYEQGIFVNRGMLHGPWLPIYGTGGLLVLIALKKFRRRPGVCLALSMLLCGVLEYFTAWVLWKKYNTIWWDYNGYFLNLDGRISAEALAIFGLGAMLFIYILAPAFDRIFEKVPDRGLKILAYILAIVFIIDFGYSIQKPNMGRGITEYKNFEENYRIEMEKKDEEAR